MMDATEIKEEKKLLSEDDKKALMDVGEGGKAKESSSDSAKKEVG